MNIATVKDAGLDALTNKIKDDLERREHSKEEWVEATIDLCLHLAEARAKFRDNISFGAWFDASGFRLNNHDRAAAAAMGQHIEIAKQVLETTESRFLKQIRSKEFNRLVHVDKTPKPKKPKPTPRDLEKALHIYDRRKQAGESLDRRAIAEEAGTSITPARFAIAQRTAEEAQQQLPEIVLSMSAQEKFDAKIRAFQKNFDFEVETKAREETRKRLDEWHIPNYLKLLHEVERMLQYKRGIMSRAEYRKILRCVHPDTGGHVSIENRNEAFRVFTQYEAKLVDDNEEARLKRVSTLPQTVEEMMARRKKKGLVK